MQFNVFINAIHLRRINLKKFAYVRLVRRAAFSKNFVCGKLGNFSSKKCKVKYMVSSLASICVNKDWFAGFSPTWPEGYKTFFMINLAEHEI